MTRNERLRWIADHVCGVSIEYRGAARPDAVVEPAEIAQALRELVQLRNEAERQAAVRLGEQRLPSGGALRRWFRWGGNT